MSSEPMIPSPGKEAPMSMEPVISLAPRSGGGIEGEAPGLTAGEAGGGSRQGAQAPKAQPPVGERGGDRGRDPGKFWNPYLAGGALGLVLLASFVVMGNGLGASGASLRLGVAAVAAVAPSAIEAAPGLARANAGGHP